MRTLNFWSNGRVQINEDPNFWSNSHAQNKEIINERGPYNLVKWSFTNKRNKSMRTLILVEWS